MISERLIGARAAKGLTQQELANKLGKSLRTVQNWEGGYTQPGGEDLRKLSAMLEKPIPYLIGEEPETILRENAPESEASFWRRRAVAAENALHNLRNELRAILDASAPAQAPHERREINSTEEPDISKETVEAALHERMGKAAHHHPPKGKA